MRGRRGLLNDVDAVDTPLDETPEGEGDVAAEDMGEKGPVLYIPGETQDSALDAADPADPEMDMTLTPEYEKALDAAVCPISIRDLGPTVEKYVDWCSDQKASLENFCTGCVIPVKREMSQAMFDKTIAEELESDAATNSSDVTTNGADAASNSSDVAIASEDLHEDVTEQVMQDRCGMDLVNMLEEKGVPINEDFNEKAFMCLTYTVDPSCPEDMEEVVKPHVDECKSTIESLYDLHQDMRYNPKTDNATVDRFCTDCYWEFMTDVMAAGANDDLLCEIKRIRDTDSLTFSDEEMAILTDIAYDYDPNAKEGVRSVLGCLSEGRAAMRKAGFLTDPLAPHLTTEIRARCWELETVNTEEQKARRATEGTGKLAERINAVKCA